MIAKRMLMLIAYAQSAKTIVEYAGNDKDGNLFVPMEWLDNLADLADAALKEYEES